MIAKSIPVTSVKSDISDSKRMAVAAINRFLRTYYPYSEELLTKSQAAQIIAGHWLSRVPGFHDDEDFLHLTRDVLAYFQSGGERSQISDQLAYFFSGFMPSYGATRILLDMVGSGQTWREVQAFMHSLSYGNARQYVESFDWAGGEKKAHAEVKAWADILQTQVDKLEALAKPVPVQLAFLAPGVPPGTFAPSGVTPVAPPVVSPPPPPMAPLGAPAAEALGTRLLTFVATKGPLLLVLLVIPSNVGQGGEDYPENVWLRKRDEAAKQKKLLVREVQEQITVAINTTNNDCKPQRTQNQENGADCENAGYTIMEQALKYQRLVDPPKGRGLDGLFEKLAPNEQPWPFPESVTAPKPGKLVFLPENGEPPKASFDYAGRPPTATYPKFVVFEAKNVAMGFEEDDKEGIQKEGKKRLKNTCDGQQLGTTWTEKRIPQALSRQNPGAKGMRAVEEKQQQIRNTGYARWLFICLPGAIGSNAKLYVFIDVVASAMDLDSMKPKPRKSDKSSTTPDSSY